MTTPRSIRPILLGALAVGLAVLAQIRLQEEGPAVHEEVIEVTPDTTVGYMTSPFSRARTGSPPFN